MKWEYKTVTFGREIFIDNPTEIFNTLGLEGWELVNTIIVAGNYLAFFKRPLIDNTLQ